MKQLLAWTGSADSTITSEAVMAMAEKFNTGQEVCLQIQRAWSYASQRGHLWIIRVARQRLEDRDAELADIGPIACSQVGWARRHGR